MRFSSKYVFHNIRDLLHFSLFLYIMKKKEGCTVFEIAIVDDDQNFLQLMENKLNENLFKTEIDYKIHSYHQVDLFKKDVNTHIFQLVFLDIDMPDENGIHLAHELLMVKHSPIVIFVTSRQDFMKDAFGLNVFAFLEKNQLDSRLPHVLMQCIHYIYENKVIVLKSNQGEIPFHIDDIICFYLSKRQLHLISLNDEFIIYQETLSQLFTRMNSDHFVYANRSSVVNLKYVLNTKERCIVLNHTEHKEFISRDRFKKFDEKLMDYTMKQELYQ